MGFATPDKLRPYLGHRAIERNTRLFEREQAAHRSRTFRGRPDGPERLLIPFTGARPVTVTVREIQHLLPMLPDGNGCPHLPAGAEILLKTVADGLELGGASRRTHTR